MECSECVNGLVRKSINGDRSIICCLDGRVVQAIVECNRFWRVADGEPYVDPWAKDKEMVGNEVVDLGYGAVPKKRGRPKK